MSNRKISVIIPVYNVEPYLEKCVKSVCEQTHSNLEIILVDDGSPDNCPALCDSLAQRDPRIRVIHKENGGVSSARNAGLDAATGDYIGFVDGDDYIEPDMYRQLLAALEETQADVAITGLKRVDEAGRVLSEHPVLGQKRLSRGEALSLMGYEPMKKRPVDIDLRYAYEVCCTKLFRREVVRAERFDESYPVGEDGLFYTHVLLQCEKAITCPGAPYCYVMRSGSAIHMGRFPEIRSSYQAAKKIVSLVKEEAQGSPQLESARLSYLVMHSFSLINNIALYHQGEQAYWEARTELMAEMPAIRKCKEEYNFKYRTGLFLLRRFPRCYWLVTRLRWGRK